MPKGRTTLSAKLRLELLQQRGHKLTIKADNTKAEITVKRADGQRHVITYTETDVPPAKRQGPAFKRYPQSTLIALALHAACDWSDNLDDQNRTESALAVDPSGCSCTLCRDGHNIPLDRAEPLNLAYILLGKQRNNTGHDINVNIEHVVTPDKRLDPTAKPHYVEARVMDHGNYRRYDIRPWWDDIQKRTKENRWATGREQS